MRRKIRRTILQAVSNFINRMDEGNSPRWIIFLLDLIIAEALVARSSRGPGPAVAWPPAAALRI